MNRNICLILFFFTANLLFGQSLEISAKHFTIENGLSNNTVGEVVQDSLGFIWIKTEVGVNRFDGYSIKNYFNIPGDSTSIQFNQIYELSVDKYNNLWVWNALGVCKYNRETDNFIRYDIAGKRTFFRDFSVTLPNGEEKQILLYGSKGLFFWNNEKLIFEKYYFPALDSLFKEKHSENLSLRFFDKKTGLLWITNRDEFSVYGCNLRLRSVREYNFVEEKEHNPEFIRFRKILPTSLGPAINYGRQIYIFNKSHNKFEIFKELNEAIPQNEIITSLFEDSDNGLWINLKNGVLLLKGQKKYLFSKDSPNPQFRSLHNKYEDILEDSKGRIHLATIGGYYILNNLENGFIRIDDLVDLTGGLFQKITELKTGEFILSSRFNGFNLLQINNQVIEKLKPHNNMGQLDETSIYGIKEDKNHNLWITPQDSGLCIYNRENKKWRYINTDKQINAELFDDNGNYWLGMREGPLIKYDKKNDKLITMSQMFRDTDMNIVNVRSLFRLNKDSLLVGTRGHGLFLFDKKRNKFIDRLLYFKNGEPIDMQDNDNFANQILTLTRINKNLFWIGTDYGFFKFDVKNKKILEHFKKEDKPNWLPGNNVFDIFIDSYNQMWIAMYDGGLSLYLGKEKGFKNFGKKGNIKFTSAFTITEDKNKNLWFITTNGIMKINPLTHKIKRYSKKDGFLGNEFNSNSLTKLSTGEIAAGGVDGLNIFYPDSLTENKNIPKMAFTKFLINNKEVKLFPDITVRKELRVDYDNKVITFEFVAFNYTNAEDNKYKYKLEGANENWVDLGKRHSITFTNLSPDDYVLRVIGSNNDGYWNNKGLSLKLSIIPPFYMTNWFYILILVFAAIPVLIIVKLRIEKYKMVDITRSRIAENLHDEFGGKLSGIGYMSSLLLTKKEIKNNAKISAIIGKISEQSQSIADDFRDIVWALNPENDDWNSLLIKYRRFVSDILDANEINYEISIPEIFPAKELDSEKKLNYMLLLKEITNNILKHSKADNVLIEISFSHGSVKTIISDDGIGFKKGDETQGNGIINIKKRLKILNAEYQLTSGENKGTRWEIIFKY